ncbi:MAG: TolC family protein [Candidatus Omnitrophica bacterium]|nr:TolC family protein [Candidatus Omnitrophota bacterium]
MQTKRIVYPLLGCIVLLLCVGIYIANAQEGKLLVPSEEPLSLQECIKLTAQNSFEVKLARLDFLIAETDIGIAEAVFDTSLFADINYERDKQEQVSVFGTDETITNTYSAGASKTFPSGTEFTLTLSDKRNWSDSQYVSRNPSHEAETSLGIRQPLAKNYFGYADRRTVSATRLAVQNADLDTKERIELLFADVEKAYWEWAFSKKRLEIYREILAKAKELHEVNTNNYDVGRIEKGDFLASQANVVIREKDVLIAENKYRRAEENMKLLININADDRIDPRESLEYRKELFNLTGCLKKAFQIRRDYQKSKTELARQKIILETKANEKWPEIDLVASMTANGIASEFSKAADRVGTGNADYYAGLEISVPLENNLAKSEFKKAAHNKEKAIIELKNIERAIITEVGNSFRDYVTYEGNVTNLIEVAELQYEKLDEEGKQFKYGRSTTKRLIDYQQDYLTAKLQVAQGLLDLETSRTNLGKTLNAILEKYERML